VKKNTSNPQKTLDAHVRLYKLIKGITLPLIEIILRKASKFSIIVKCQAKWAMFLDSENQNRN